MSLENIEYREEHEISTLITCYFEERTIGTFHARRSRALVKTGQDYAIVFVNDDSTNATFVKLQFIFDQETVNITLFDGLIS
ncbi:MAG TPA: hypothetical protein PLI09_10180 [Candidatus Hydrogenedentes bacterium]|nr:hypothetical protein [Candidatus Hydrogenedentota bacterium]